MALEETSGWIPLLRVGNGVDEVAVDAAEGADGVGIVYPKRR